VRALPDAAALGFTLDGRTVGQLTPVAPAAAGFSWLRVAVSGLSPGPHRLGVVARPSAYGAAYEVGDVRLLDARTRLTAEQALGGALAIAAPRTAYAGDLGDALRTANPALLAPGHAIGGGAGYWKALEPDRLSLGREPAGMSVSFRTGRRYHALLAHYFRTPRNWGAHAYAFLRVRGQASGGVFRILIDGDAHHRYTNQLLWSDRQPGWRWLALPLFANRAVARHVVSVRIAADDVGRAGRLEVGALALSPAISTVAVHLPIPSADAARAQLVDQPQPARQARRGRHAPPTVIRPQADGIAVRIPLKTLGAHYLLLVPPRTGVPKAPSPGLSWVQYGFDHFSFSVHATKPFTLVLTRSQDAHWRLSGVRGSQPVRTWATLQAWRLPAGNYHGTITYPGDRLVQLGVIGSTLFAALIALVMLLWPRRRGKDDSGEPDATGALISPAPAPGSRDEPARARAIRRTWSDWIWRAPWLIALVLLIPIPIAVAHGPRPLGNGLAVAATLTMALAIAIAALHTRRRCDDPDS
jgi:hypothetical protein